MKEAYLYRPLSEGAVQCRVCEHFCAIPPGEFGTCGVRCNHEGTLRSAVYNHPVSINLDPVEKKPLYHFLPGGEILSIGAYGCNFHCAFCQNWRISQRRDVKECAEVGGRIATPQTLIDICLRRGVGMIAYTYNEPTVFFEYTYDTARLGHEHGLHNVYVSNGFMSQEMLEMLAPYLDAINVDLKAFDDGFYRDHCGGRLEPVKRNIRTFAQETGVWIEVTTLLIPGLNDSDAELRALVAWLAEVDPEMPWHISAFRPDYRMIDRPATPANALRRAYEIGQEAGLRYIYLGNVMDPDRGTTYCPACGEILVQRHWYTVRERWQERGRCPTCGHVVAGVWS
ncbi:MAG: AmmeMemoRadiSam system radical SAM enzyme [Anaerolineae bacterium]